MVFEGIGEGRRFFDDDGEQARSFFDVADVRMGACPQVEPFEIVAAGRAADGQAEFVHRAAPKFQHRLCERRYWPRLLRLRLQHLAAVSAIGQSHAP